MIYLSCSFAILVLTIVRWFVRSTCRVYDHKINITGSVIIVTGANSGIGFETAKYFAKKKARVILACRNRARGLEAKEKIIAMTGNTDVVYKHLDLSSLASVRDFAIDIYRSERELNVLVNNAGVGGLKGLSQDGLQIMMQINYFGPFLLTNLLLPLLIRTKVSRVINVSSDSHFFGQLDLDNMKMENKNDFEVYATSKLCNILMTNELSRRLSRSGNYGVVSNAVSPGRTSTNIFRNIPNPCKRLSMILFRWLFCQKSCEGAQTILYVSLAPEMANVSGKYFYNCMPKKSSPFARDKMLASRLWDLSEKMVFLK